MMRRFFPMAARALPEERSDLIGVIAVIDDALCALHDMDKGTYDYWIDRIEHAIQRKSD